jgi:regulator of sirC expression with transglutaminase-like and TPR domain
MEPVAHKRLQKLASAPDQELDLAEAALLIACDEYPDLDVDAYLRRLDELARQVKHEIPARASLEEVIVTLNQVLFVDQGFSGNTDNYYDPRNSFLNEVLDRKLGIPITLSILYLEIGRRLGLPLEGVSFPGHFLVKFATDEGAVVLDPFHGGIPLTEEDLRERLEEMYGEQPVPDAPLTQLLGAAGKKEILLRMLRNLKAIYLHTQDLPKALRACNSILFIVPDLPEEIRDRGRIYDRLECFRAAAEDYERYLALDPLSDDTPEIHHRLIELKQIVSSMN